MTEQTIPTYRVGILGATGTVGQRFVQLLAHHPYFVVTCLGASERSEGHKYQEVVKWKIPHDDVKEKTSNIAVTLCNPDLFKGKCDLIFSGLDASVAGDIETHFAEAGFPVFSNAKNHRYDPHVPILLPAINAQHLEAITRQDTFKNNGSGYIITNANCSSTGLSIVLGALMDLQGGINRVMVTTMQAISGAGYPGVPSMDILDNVIPHVGGEEEKVEYEPTKILAHFLEGSDGFLSSFQPAQIKLSAMCNRVGVTDGHTLSVSIEFNKPFESKPQAVAAVKNRLITFSPKEALVTNLPSSPRKFIVLKEEIDRPQPRLDRTAGNGMTTTVGQVRPCPLFDVKLTILSHNTIIGAAGGSLLNAELAVAQAFVKRNT